jgi:hypothetical protein
VEEEEEEEEEEDKAEEEEQEKGVEWRSMTWRATSARPYPAGLRRDPPHHTVVVHHQAPQPLRVQLVHRHVARVQGLTLVLISAQLEIFCPPYSPT